jgi:Swiss Army Knife protein, DSP-PTPase phosphatase domain
MSRHNVGVACQHTEHAVTFPDGTTVLASGWLSRAHGAWRPDFGVYLDPSWEPDWPHVMLDWPDFGVPADTEVATHEIRAAYERARRGESVEVACIGGHGRTGTVLACMAVLAGVPVNDAVAWVRETYCSRAVQEPSQQYWIEHRAAPVLHAARE